MKARSLNRITRLVVLYLGALHTPVCHSGDALPPTVSNVRAAQRAGSEWVDITFDLADPDSARLSVNVVVSDNGGVTFAVPATSFSGEGYGASVSPGTRKQVLWDAGRDWPNRFSANMRFRVTATDGEEPPDPDSPRLVWISAGTFTMGSPESEPYRWPDEGPQTHITISLGFWLGKYEVTQREYQGVMGNNPSDFTSDLAALPVQNVTWNDATNYCGRLTERERVSGRLLDGYEYGLPTEAQWEYTCRAGTTTATAFGDSLSSGQANFNGNYPYNGAAKGPYIGGPTTVGSYAPNAWGLYDMHGNHLEWCQDWYTHAYLGGSVVDPEGPASGSLRVARGGEWADLGQSCRSALRVGYAPDRRIQGVGFRVALLPVR